MSLASLREMSGCQNGALALTLTSLPVFVLVFVGPGDTETGATTPTSVYVSSAAGRAGVRAGGPLAAELLIYVWSSCSAGTVSPTSRGASSMSRKPSSSSSCVSPIAKSPRVSLKAASSMSSPSGSRCAKPIKSSSSIDSFLVSAGGGDGSSGGGARC